ncbi:MAG: hypothetical protein E7557_05490 [Ruminococcaceae bacterium]|nr:hypothetical protein [Oscillospiraceae bacterium]
MKRILSFSLVIIIVLSVFVGCSKTPAEETESTTKGSSTQYTVKISGDSFTEDFSEIEFYELLDGIDGLFHTKNIETNEYTLQMTEEAYKKLKEIKSKDAIKSFDEIKNDTENYVTDINYDDDFRNIKVIADREKLPEGSISVLDDVVLKIVSQAMAYQIYTVEGQNVKISVICSDNEEVVFETAFPIVIE